MDKTRTARQRKVEGAHYTPPLLADFVARHMTEVWTAPTRPRVRLLDPAVGDGSLLIALVNRLNSKEGSSVEAIGFDTSRGAIDRARRALVSAERRATIALRVEDFLEVTAPSVSSQENLFNVGSDPIEPFDLVIANPPYVRTQVMGAKRAQELADTFELTGRVDLCFAFIRAIGRVLRPGGVAGIIVSNRFMTTQSGAALRESISNDFDILKIVDFGDTRLFEAAVLPAVLILRRKAGEASVETADYVSIYSGRDGSVATPSEGVFDAIQTPGLHQLPSGEVFEVKHGRLDIGVSQSSVWRLATEVGDDWLAKVAAHTAMNFADVGPIRVGIKTTADKVFIRSDWDELLPSQRPELLRPVITHHGASRFRSGGRAHAMQVLYTHTVEGGRRRAVKLSEYPNAARYLEGHRDRLAGRSYVLDAGREWYEIWVPQDPEAWRLPKLVFRDISEQPMFWIDREGWVVNGDCYWLAVETEQVDLIYLAAAVGNSTFIEAFYDHRFNNKLYAGRRRFITQYVREFPLPDPKSDVAARMISIAKRLSNEAPPDDAKQLAVELDDLTWLAFGLRGEEGGR